MNSDIQKKFDAYPAHIQPLMLQLRSLILDVAQEQNLGTVEESLKWGEPSFSTSSGSPVRIDWKPKTPNQYYIFFVCTTTLVETFRELHGDVLQFEGKRAIVLTVAEPKISDAIAHCLALALNYKKLKHLPLLGA